MLTSGIVNVSDPSIYPLSMKYIIEYTNKSASAELVKIYSGRKLDLRSKRFCLSYIKDMEILLNYSQTDKIYTFIEGKQRAEIIRLSGSLVDRLNLNGVKNLILVLRENDLLNVSFNNKILQCYPYFDEGKNQGYFLKYLLDKGILSLEECPLTKLDPFAITRLKPDNYIFSKKFQFNSDSMTKMVNKWIVDENFRITECFKYADCTNVLKKMHVKNITDKTPIKIVYKFFTKSGGFLYTGSFKSGSYKTYKFLIRTKKDFKAVKNFGNDFWRNLRFKDLKDIYKLYDKIPGRCLRNIKINVIKKLLKIGKYSDFDAKWLNKISESRMIKIFTSLLSNKKFTSFLVEMSDFELDEFLYNLRIKISEDLRDLLIDKLNYCGKCIYLMKSECEISEKINSLSTEQREKYKNIIFEKMLQYKNTENVVNLKGTFPWTDNINYLSIAIHFNWKCTSFPDYIEDMILASYYYVDPKIKNYGLIFNLLSFLVLLDHVDVEDLLTFYRVFTRKVIFNTVTMKKIIDHPKSGPFKSLYLVTDNLEYFFKEILLNYDLY
jgi:hypothetical protein